jgi:hypothetical protein
MPATIDTHTHLSRPREMLIADLQQRGCYAVVFASPLTSAICPMTGNC